MAKIFLIGDCHGLNPIFEENSQIENWGINGLPIWDLELKQKFEEIASKDFEKIYFSCGHPLMGCKKISEILELSDNNFLTFTQDERSFLDRKDYKELPSNKIQDLCKKYLDYISFLINSTPNITLLPITILWHEKIRKSKLNMPELYDELKKFSHINVETYLKSKFDFINRFGELHPKSATKIMTLF